MTRLTFIILSLLTIALLVAGAVWLSREYTIATVLASQAQDPMEKALAAWNTNMLGNASAIATIGAVVAISVLAGTLVSGDAWYKTRRPTP